MSHKNDKVLIYTLYGYFNYGNRLQNYALAKVLRGLDKRVKTVNTCSAKRKIYDFAIFHLFRQFAGRKKYCLYTFTKKKIKNDFLCNKKISCMVSGSDQVWNPNYLKNKPYLLDMPGDVPKISYAASIGSDKLTAEQKQLFSKALGKYAAISVREQTAKDLLDPLVNNAKIEVVLDPTLLLDKTEYEKLEIQPKDIEQNQKYILCYILGDRSHQEAIERYAKENDYKVIIFSDKQGSDYSVEEFLYLIHHAELVCTDSFHACVFSFLFDRPFVVFKRDGEANYMYTRIQNLIDIFNLKDREYNGSKITDKNTTVDYGRAKRILEEKRRDSIEFLKEALEKR